MKILKNAPPYTKISYKNLKLNLMNKRMKFQAN